MTPLSDEPLESFKQISEHLFVRRFWLEDIEHGQQKREVMQVHFTGWPDHGVPKNLAAVESFSTMLEICLLQMLKG